MAGQVGTRVRPEKEQLGGDGKTDRRVRPNSWREWEEGRWLARDLGELCAGCGDTALTCTPGSASSLWTPQSRQPHVQESGGMCQVHLRGNGGGD